MERVGVGWRLALAVGLVAGPGLLAAAEPVPVAAPALAAPAAPTTSPGFLALSDIHLATSSGLKCMPSGPETSPALWDAARAQAKALVQSEKPAFVIYVGDLPAHCGGQSAAEFKATLDGLADIVGTGTRLIYVPGNNDSLDGDYGPFSDSNGATPLSQSPVWNMGIAPNLQTPVLNAQAGDMIDWSRLSKGYYSVYAVQRTATAPALRVLALNTNMFTANYSGLNASDQVDTNAQLEWIDTQLQDARTSGDRVVIAMHVPPGVDGYVGRSGGVTTMWDRSLQYTGGVLNPKPEWVQATFLRIVAKYGPEIVGLLSSHTHFNEIRRLHDCTPQSTFTELDVAIPSITTDHGNNPSVKLFTYDSQFEWTENVTYYTPDSSGAGWATTRTLSFDVENYPCQPTSGCPAGTSLKTRIETIAAQLQPNPTKGLVKLMMAWLKVGAGTPRPGNYVKSLDAVCDLP